MDPHNENDTNIPSENDHEDTSITDNDDEHNNDNNSVVSIDYMFDDVMEILYKYYTKNPDSFRHSIYETAILQNWPDNITMTTRPDIQVALKYIWTSDMLPDIINIGPVLNSFMNQEMKRYSEHMVITYFKNRGETHRINNTHNGRVCLAINKWLSPWGYHYFRSFITGIDHYWSYSSEHVNLQYIEKNLFTHNHSIHLEGVKDAIQTMYNRDVNTLKPDVNSFLSNEKIIQYHGKQLFSSSISNILDDCNQLLEQIYHDVFNNSNLILKEILHYAHTFLEPFLVSPLRMHKLQKECSINEPLLFDMDKPFWIKIKILQQIYNIVHKLYREYQYYYNPDYIIMNKLSINPTEFPSWRSVYNWFQIQVSDKGKSYFTYLFPILQYGEIWYKLWGKSDNYSVVSLVYPGYLHLLREWTQASTTVVYNTKYHHMEEMVAIANYFIDRLQYYFTPIFNDGFYYAATWLDPITHYIIDLYSSQDIIDKTKEYIALHCVKYNYFPITDPYELVTSVKSNSIPFKFSSTNITSPSTTTSSTSSEDYYNLEKAKFTLTTEYNTWKYFMDIAAVNHVYCLDFYSKLDIKKITWINQYR